MAEADESHTESLGANGGNPESLMSGWGSPTPLSVRGTGMASAPQHPVGAEGAQRSHPKASEGLGTGPVPENGTEPAGPGRWGRVVPGRQVPPAFTSCGSGQRAAPSLHLLPHGLPACRAHSCSTVRGHQAVLLSVTGREPLWHSSAREPAQDLTLGAPLLISLLHLCQSPGWRPCRT